MMYELGQYINGEHITSTTAASQPIINPAFDQAIGKLHFADEQQVQMAIDSSAQAFETWSRTSPLKRARILFNFKMLLEKHMDEIATLVTTEHGKTFEDAKGSVMRGIEVVEQNCTVGAQLKGGYSQAVGTDIDTYTMRQPLGICAGVSPFNFPVMVPIWMMIPAIACGNTFILKPSEQTPSAPIRLVELLKEAGLPNGVVNILNGDKTIVDALLHEPKIQAMTAVASTPVAEYIYQTSSNQGKRSHTFGGAKNHCIVMPDANLDYTAGAIAGAAFGAAGERCMALSVAVVIGDQTADELCEHLLAKMKDIKVGNGLEANMDMGPLVNKAHKEKVENYIQLGTEEGASLLADGRNIYPDNPGYFVGPTLFDKVTESMRIYQEEIFGPVLCVIRAASFEEAVALINRHQFGNGTAIFTHDGYAARQFASEVQAGMVGINIPIPVPVAYHPFGGWKRSVFGDMNMHGEDSIKFYTKQKTITSRWIKDDVTQNNFVMPTLGE
jgi:malonate-semialdehyde dehydrogenase (acetylating)/methylmalonate-semialdehyde dehydrogenase